MSFQSLFSSFRRVVWKWRQKVKRQSWMSPQSVTFFGCPTIIKNKLMNIIRQDSFINIRLGKLWRRRLRSLRFAILFMSDPFLYKLRTSFCRFLTGSPSWWGNNTKSTCGQNLVPAAATACGVYQDNIVVLVWGHRECVMPGKFAASSRLPEKNVIELKTFFPESVLHVTIGTPCFVLVKSVALSGFQ
jgi:hypothetical protein